MSRCLWALSLQSLQYGNTCKGPDIISQPSVHLRSSSCRGWFSVAVAMASLLSAARPSTRVGAHQYKVSFLFFCLSLFLSFSLSLFLSLSLSVVRVAMSLLCHPVTQLTMFRGGLVVLGGGRGWWGGGGEPADVVIPCLCMSV